MDGQSQVKWKYGWMDGQMDNLDGPINWMELIKGIDVCNGFNGLIYKEMN